jgi:hypothetical protein
VIAAYALGAWWIYRPLGLVDSHRLPSCACGDVALQVWFLGLAHTAVVHHHFSFLTTRLDYPRGINLMDNTGLPLLGVLAAPLTAVAGPVAALDFLLRLGFLLSAVSCFLVLRRLVRSTLAAAAGGALYGFSPYMAHQGASHLFLVFVPLPPILYLLVSRLPETGRRRPLILGVTLGLLMVAQYFISSEILVTTCLLLALTGALIAAARLVRRRAITEQLRAAFPPAAVAALVAVAALAYPAWYALAGPRHISGATQAVNAPGIDLADVVLPVTRQVLAARWLGIPRVPVPFQGGTAFLGVPLLVVLLVVVLTCRRSPVVRFAAVFGGLAALLAMGSRLVVDGRTTSIPLPFALLTHLPVLQDVVPSRLTLFVDLAAAVILAVGVDRLVRAVRTRRPWLALGRLAGGAFAALALAFVLPATTYLSAGIGVAASFRSPALLHALPANGVALTYPYPVYPENRAMIWQAESGMRFSLVGGYAVGPADGDLQTKLPPMLAPAVVPTAFERAWPATAVPGTGRPSLDAASDALPEFVARYDITSILVVRAGAEPGRVISLVTAVYGPPRRFGRLEVWTDLHRGLEPIGLSRESARADLTGKPDRET